MNPGTLFLIFGSVLLIGGGALWGWIWHEFYDEIDPGAITALVAGAILLTAVIR